VLDNWWRDPIENKEKVQYLITAFLKDDEEDSAAELTELRDELLNLRETVKHTQEKLINKVNQVIYSSK
jgi:hypothetical protein